MSDREPIRRIDRDADKTNARNQYLALCVLKALEGRKLNERIPEPAKNSQVFEKYDSAMLTLQDLKFLYDCGISRE